MCGHDGLLEKMYDAGEICLYRGYTHTGTCTCSSTQYPPKMCAQTLAHHCAEKHSHRQAAGLTHTQPDLRGGSQSEGEKNPLCSVLELHTALSQL